jgi:hypothetical protein
LSSSIRSLILLGLWFGAGVASAQDQPPPQALPPASWQVAFDGVLFATYDRQGGLRGDTALTSQNWLMATARRPVKTGTLTLTAMLSAEPLTIGPAGYPQVFQEGETYRNLQITDRQHPHDLFMQLSAAWRQPIGAGGITVSGAPVGEAALGPVAFMHRPSASENPSAPLTHHIFDSTHIVDGVITLGADRGPLAIEASFFRGREPDDHRYDLEFGALDSWSARVWFRPTPAWSVQVSHGFLHEPEALEPGDQRRTNASVSWLRQPDEDHVTAVTGAVGRTARPFSTLRGVLLEATHCAGRTSLYSRYEHRTLETEILLFPQIVHVPHPGELVDPIQALTVGMVRDFAEWRGFRIGGGADIVFHRVPDLLEFTHGANVRSGHVFIRVRPARGHAHVH